MTIGEKIQFHRKRVGLSQEELAKRMLLSRQTISLWEMDKTVPTLENLIRFKEILGVSVDELLGDDKLLENIENEIIVEGANEENVVDESQIDSIEPDDASIPDNVHVFKYEKAELKRIFKKLCAPMWRLFILFTILLAVSLVMMFDTEGDDTLFFFVAGMALVYFVYFIKWYISYRKAWNKSAMRMLKSVYSYQVFDGYFVLNIFSDGEAKKWFKIGFDEIESVRIIDEHFVLTIAGQIHIIRKQDLPQNSPLLTFCNGFSRKRNKKNSHVVRMPFQIISLLLQTYFIVETIRLYCCGYVTYMGDPVESSWFSMLFTLIVVAACEVVSFVEAIIFVRTKRTVYSKIYLALIIVNACCFMSMAYYSTLGTIICLSFYAILFVLRIINFVINLIDLRKKRYAKP